MQHNPTPRLGARLPQSPEVERHAVRLEVATYDATLSRDVADLRAEVEPLMAQLVPLLERIHPLIERAGVVADGIDNAPGDASSETWDSVMQAVGGHELHDVFQRLGDTFPRGLVDTEPRPLVDTA
jgi:hypothetical protein